MLALINTDYSSSLLLPLFPFLPLIIYYLSLDGFFFRTFFNLQNENVKIVKRETLADEKVRVAGEKTALDKAIASVATDKANIITDEAAVAANQDAEIAAVKQHDQAVHDNKAADDAIIEYLKIYTDYKATSVSKFFSRAY